MKLRTRETIEQLTRFIHLCSESRAELEWALRRMRDPHLHGVLQTLSTDRSRYIAELDETIRALGGAPPPTDFEFGTERIDRALDDESQEAALLDCAREEERILSAYEHAVQEGGFDAATQRMLENQYAEIHAACDRIRSLSEHVALSGH